MKMSADTIERKSYGSVCVLGWGMTGREVTDYLIPLIGQRVEELTLYTGGSKPDRTAEEKLRKAGVRVIYGEEVSGRYDLCIASPGDPVLVRILQKRGEMLA